ncbi:hypothetical protein GCM10023322_46460 [Rugosimonospora acidiphila]|uniref:Uncharacterized protein n=1 Tax=Rugosimonospora acidiphila TaxID=556531 RepID=A0ABP9S2V0_9ACTN
MQINTVEQAHNLYDDGNIRQGERTVKSLLVGQEGAPDNYKFAYSYGEGDSEWATPRHRHLFDQIRHPVEGDYSIGKNRVLPAGWVGYFPESAYYGPQVMSPNLRMCVLQFGGATGRGFYSTTQRKHAIAQLKAKGTLKNGIFQWVDEQGRTHNQDAGEALWEAACNEPADYPPSRYSDLVLINPATFEWREDQGAPGVARKVLGSFTERDIRIQLLRVESGATLEFGTQPSSEVLFLKEGRLEADGTVHERLTGFGSAAADQPVQLRAHERAELLYIKLPTF